MRTVANGVKATVLGVMILAMAGCGAAPAARPAADPTLGVSSHGPVAVPNPGGGKWDRYIAEASDRFQVPEEWIRAVMQQESSGRTHFSDGRPLISRAGAIGLMQVIPSTYRELAQRHDLGRDPFNPRDNVLAGTAYIRQMYDQFGSPHFLGAYNAGPGRYGRYLRGEASLPLETRRYLEALAPIVVAFLPEDHPNARTRLAAAPPQPRPPRPEAVRVTWADVPDHLSTVEVRLQFPELFRRP